MCKTMKKAAIGAGLGVATLGLLFGTSAKHYVRRPSIRSGPRRRTGSPSSTRSMRPASRSPRSSRRSWRASRRLARARSRSTG